MCPEFYTNVKETFLMFQYFSVGPIRRRTGSRRGPPRRGPARPRLESLRDNWSYRDTAPGSLNIQTEGWKPLSSNGQ